MYMRASLTHSSSNMQAVTVVVFALLVVVANGAEEYTGTWKKVNVDEVLKNDRLVDNYVLCFLDKGPCTPDATEIKTIIPDALQNDCAKCSEEDKKKGDKVLHLLVKKRSEQFNELTKKYDPDNIYQTKYADMIKKLRE